jgi:pheromone shutdown-related protein TraB
VILVGTAHVSRESAELVRRVIETERPDRVCIELDPQRFKALNEEQRFEELDLREVIRERQLATLMLNLVLASYQRQLGLKLGVLPGTELLEAAHAAEELGIPVELCDRDVRITLHRAWRAVPWWRKLLLLSGLFATLFERQEITEEDLRKLREEDVLSRLMQELGNTFPGLKRVLIDERDTYLAARILQSEGDRLVAVVGAGHVAGIRAALESAGESAEHADLAPLEEIPPASGVWKAVGWAIPAAIVSALVAIGVRHGAGAAGENLVFWILANGVPAAIGAIFALAHPATTVAAFAAAPVTSLTPVIGAGYVTAFVQTYYRPPLVRELRGVSNEIQHPLNWWRNRLLRIFLVFVFTTLGSLLGTWAGGAKIATSLF